MKKLIILLAVTAVLFSGIFVSCSKKISDEDIKKKIEANSENRKNIKKRLIRPIMKKKIDVRKLRRALKNKKRGIAGEGTAADTKVGKSAEPREKQIKSETKKLKVEKKEKSPAEDTPEKK